MTLNILNKINEPKDLKSLSREELNLLSSEIRDVLIKSKYYGRSFWTKLRNGRSYYSTSLCI